MNQKKSKLPVMFWVIAVIAILWNAMGVAAYLSDMLITPERLQAMEPAMRTFYEDNPIYLKIVYGLAVFGGLLGAISLALRKSWAIPLFLISLVCVILQLIISLTATDALEILGPTALIMPSLVILIAAFLYWHSRNAKKSGQIV